MQDVNGVYCCDICNKVVPAEYTVGMDSRAKLDFQIDTGDIHCCAKCLPKTINLGLRIFMELSVNRIGTPE